MFGTIRAHQERRYPARPHGTDLQNPDFTALGQSFGLFAQRVARTDEIAAAFDAALAHDGPALIELILDAEAASTNASLTQIREKALAG
jgi:acetolactate synthase-1/2/3 large subunit